MRLESAGRAASRIAAGVTVAVALMLLPAAAQAASGGYSKISSMSAQRADTLAAGGVLRANQSEWSSNGSYRLIMQGDGNLVLYGPSGALWASSTSGAGNWAVMQGDGNLVVYNSASHPLWATGTGWAGSVLVVSGHAVCT
jgi:hypothetical protein